MPSVCSVPCCKKISVKGNSSIIFHMLPQDPELCTKWLQVIGLSDQASSQYKKKTSYRICSDHFKKSSYIYKKTLKANAVPSIGLGLDLSDEENDDETSDEDVTSHADNIVINDKRLKTKFPKKLLMFFKTCKRRLNPEMVELIKTEMFLKKISAKERRMEYNLSCLNLCYSNPNSYKFLKQLVGFPSISRLKRIFIPVTAGCLSQHCIEILRLMADETVAKDRCCILALGALPLKSHLYYDIKNDEIHGLRLVDDERVLAPATKAFVIVAQGMFTKWKLPLAYILLSETDVERDIVMWTDYVIRTLLKLGFDVRALTSDQNSDLINASRFRNISAENTFFTVEEKKIYYIFDVPCLLKSAWDRLMANRLLVGIDEYADWKHVLKVYEDDKHQDLKLAPKLTEAHINPNENQKRHTVLAAQVFSKSVATAISTLIRFKILDPSAQVTVNLILKLNLLFDMLNSDKVNDSGYKKELRGEKWQIDFLDEMAEYFKMLVSVQGYYNVEPPVFINGFLITINSVKQLWEDLKEDGSPFLLTRFLNRDCLDDFYIRAIVHNNNRETFTGIQLNRAFRKIFIDELLNNSELNHSTDNLTAAISNISDYFEIHRDDEVTALLSVGVTDYKNLPSKDITAISVYLMKKVLDDFAYGHQCPDLIKFLKRADEETKNVTSFTYSSYDKTKSKLTENLVTLPYGFVNFVMNLEKRFVEKVRFYNQAVGQELLETMADIEITPCSCFPLNFVKKLFLRLRLYHFLLMNNRRFKASVENRKFIEIKSLL